MENIYRFFFVFFVGFLGFLISRRLKIPTPAIIGSIFATGILNAAGYYPEIKMEKFSLLVKIATGVMLGKEINRSFFRHIKNIAAYVLLFTAGMFAASVATGYTIYYLSDVSLATALVGGASGGIIGMVTFGMSIRADAVPILFMQIFRLILAVTLYPWIALLVGKAVPGKTTKPRLQSSAEDLFSWKYDYVFLMGTAFLGAWLFDTLEVPNGIIIGPMLLCGLLSVCIRKTYKFSPKVRYTVQIALGVIMGQSVTPDVAGELHRLIFPALVSSVVMLAGSMLLAAILYKITSMDVVTCILCTSPVGLSQIVFISDEMGADGLTTSIFQICRVLSIITFYPWIVTAIV